MAKKIVRLTESDLVRLVNRVVKEQYDDRDGFQVRDDVDDLQYEVSDTMIFLKNKSSRQVRKVISNLSEKIKFFSLLNCEYADFSDINLCEYPNLMVVRLKGTPNNLEETQDECYEEFMESQYHFNIPQ